MADFNQDIVDTSIEFIKAFVELKDEYKANPFTSAGYIKALKDDWYLRLDEFGRITLINDKIEMRSGEDIFFDKHMSTMALILRDYLAMLFD